MFAEVPAKSENADSDLLIGDYVTAKINGKTLQNVIRLPRQSLVDGNAIWVVDDGLIFKRNVQIEWLDDENVVINAEDIADGALVNTTALGYMISGSRVRIVERDGKAVISDNENPGANNGSRAAGIPPKNNSQKPQTGQP